MRAAGEGRREGGAGVKGAIGCPWLCVWKAPVGDWSRLVRVLAHTASTPRPSVPAPVAPACPSPPVRSAMLLYLAMPSLRK